MDMAIDLLRREVGYESFDAVAGGETAGIPYAAWIAERMMLPMLYVRKQPSGDGEHPRVEGVFERGQRVLLVEDLATYGGTKLDFVQALREAGAVVSHCFVIFDYGIFPQSVSGLQSAGVTLHSLANWDDIVTEAQRGGFFGLDVLSEVRRYLADPDTWSQPAA